MEFCPGCGKKSKTICKDCRSVKEIKTKDIHVKLCADCKKYFLKNKWHSYKKIDDAIIRIAKESIKEKTSKIKPELKDVKINPGINVDFPVKVTIDNEIFHLPATLEVTYCNNCAKQQGDYFEGILQLRNVSDEIMKFIRKYLKKNSIFTPDETETKNGIDIKITDKRKVQHLGQELQKKFGGIVKINAQLYSHDKQTSKDLFRVNVYYEGPQYKKGEVVKVDNKVILIKKLTKTIVGIDLKTGKKVSVNLKNKDIEVLKPVKTRVSKIHPNLEVIDPETYQSVNVENTKKVKQGEKVKVVNNHGQFYII